MKSVVVMSVVVLVVVVVDGFCCRFVCLFVCLFVCWLVCLEWPACAWDLKHVALATRLALICVRMFVVLARIALMPLGMAETGTWGQVAQELGR